MGHSRSTAVSSRKMLKIVSSSIFACAISASCSIAEQMYEEWGDTQLQSDFQDYKVCVQDETCSAIDDGACYQDELFPY